MLTERQYEIASLVATGASNKETPALACGASVARRLSTGIKTVKNTLTTVFEKTGARGRTDSAAQVVRGTGATNRAS